MRIQINDKTGLTGIGNDVLDYLKGLKVGEEVIEAGQSGMFGKRGTVYESKDGGGTCVKWDMGKGSWMGTTVTWGTRRISDVEVTELPPLPPRVKDQKELEAEIEGLESELEAWKGLGDRLSRHAGRFEVEEELEKAKKALAELVKG